MTRRRKRLLSVTRRAVSAVATILLLLTALAACGSGSKSSSGASVPPTSTTGITGGGTATSHRKSGVRCIPGSRGLVHAIQLGLNGRGGRTLTHVYAVRSRSSFPKAPPSLRAGVYFVSAAVLNVSHKPDIATWVTGSLSGRKLIYPMSSLANDISTFKNIGGSSSQPAALAYGFKHSSDGFKASGKCVEVGAGAR
jgi:hypothetical protein